METVCSSADRLVNYIGSAKYSLQILSSVLLVCSSRGCVKKSNNDLKSVGSDCDCSVGGCNRSLSYSSSRFRRDGQTKED